jgi:chemotaxis protein CheC
MELAEAPFSSLQLDALRDLAKVGAETAATALSSLLGRPVEIDLARAAAPPVAEAVERCGPGDAVVTAIAVPAVGDLDALALILMPAPTVHTLCELLGVDPDGDLGASALCEVGNILGSSYLGALAAMTRLQLWPGPPERVVDMAAAILASAFLASGDGNTALLLESRLSVAEAECSPAFLFIPSPAGLKRLFSRLGVAA